MATSGIEARRETRASRAVELELSALHWPLGRAAATTQNVSVRGARVLTQRRWYPGDRVGVDSVDGQVSVTGRVVYCVRGAGGKFAIGLELLSPINKWDTTP